ncbi:hypothetical protein [Ideonella paludis]|uniref:hypothetical protein n=1 Tax=Ideonella paludis TaxID=1233411 RepID=UPI0036313492
MAMTTASGRTAPGLRADLSLGSFGRKRMDASHGAVHEGGWDHYVAVGGFDETGWRDHSKGDLTHFNAKLGHQGELGRFSLGLLHGQSTLIGNGLVPWVTLDEDGQGTPDLGALRRSAVYTHPDLTRNRLSQVTGSWSRSLDGGMNLETLVWWRDSRRETVNGDEAEEVVEGSDVNASLNRTLTTQRGAASRWRSQAAAVRTNGSWAALWSPPGCAMSKPSKRASLTTPAAWCQKTSPPS